MERPWWAHPMFWLAVAVLMLILGFTVFRGAFFFLPFLWISPGAWSMLRRRRRHTDQL